jgi:hypothetical protein
VQQACSRADLLSLPVKVITGGAPGLLTMTAKAFILGAGRSDTRNEHFWEFMIIVSNIPTKEGMS